MRLRMLISRLWAGHRAMVVAIPAVVLVAVLAGGLVAVSASGGFAQATPTAAPTPTATPAPTDTPEPTPEPTAVPVPTPTPFPSGMAYAQLDGVLTTAALANRLPMAVMIDNQVAARPQSGISAASIVYQAPADGNQDRYMMIFQEGSSSSIGPVRSTRPYYVEWASEYKALLGHFGGSSIALKVTLPKMIAAKTIYNMDALRYKQGCPYKRISTRPRPHNAYTGTGALINCLKSLKYPVTSQTTTTRPFREDSAVADRPATQNITIAYRTGTVGYEYHWYTDSYIRITDGKYEVDPATGGHVFARNIIVMYQTVEIDPRSEVGHTRPLIATVGSGKAIVFQEGRQIAATWKKTSISALTRFYDKSGKEIQLVRGEIFIQSIQPGYAVTVK